MPNQNENTRPTGTKSLGPFATGSCRIASKSPSGLAPRLGLVFNGLEIADPPDLLLHLSE